MKWRNKQKVNIVIDVVMLLVMMFLIAVGIVIRYTLIPGSERWIKYGKNVELTVFGMDRHQWGYIHLVVGVVLSALLVVHLVLHWKQIVNMITKLLPQRSVRVATSTGIVIICTLIALAPVFISPEIGKPVNGQGDTMGKHQFKNENRNVTHVNSTHREEVAMVETGTKQEKEHTGENRVLDIKGFNTIEELSQQYHISANELKTSLNIPAEVSNDERLGRIRRNYSFTMSDVEKAILNLQES